MQQKQASEVQPVLQTPSRITLQTDGRRFLWHLTALLGAALLGGAAVCWIADYWPWASAAQKLAGTQILLATSALLACMVLLRGKANRHHGQATWPFLAHIALGLAALLTGALLALIGQIYQTGADPWQWLLLWAALLLPWVLAQPNLFLLGLWCVLLNVGAALFVVRVFGWRDPQSVPSALGLALLNAVLLAAHEGLSLRVRSLGVQGYDRWRVLPRLLAAALMGWWLLAFILDLSFLQQSLWPGVLVGGVLVGVYTRARPDAVILSLLALTACIAVSSLIFDRTELNTALTLNVILLVAVLVFGLPRLIKALRSLYPVDANPAHADGNRPDPWFVSTLRLALMLFLAIVALAFMYFVLDMDGMQVSAMGAVLMLPGILLIWRNRQSGPSILRDFGTACVLAGYTAWAFSIVVKSGLSPGEQALMAGLPAVLVYLACPIFTLRVYCTLISLMLVEHWVWPNMTAWIFGPATDDYTAFERTALLGGLALLTWRAASCPAPRHARRAIHLAPLAWALLWLSFEAALTIQTEFWWQTVQHTTPWLWSMTAVLLALPLYALYRLWSAGTARSFWPWGGLATLWLLLACLPWLRAPGALVALAALMLGYVLRQRMLMAVNLLALPGYLALCYYPLETGLLDKAQTLGLTGAWLVAGAALLAWAGKHNARPPAAWTQPGQTHALAGAAVRRSTMQVAAVLLGLLLVLGLANRSIQTHKRLIRDGVHVVLELVPVNPRALEQTNTMRLRWRVSADADRQLGSNTLNRLEHYNTLRKPAGRLMLQRDENGIHQLADIVLEKNENGKESSEESNEKSSGQRQKENNNPASAAKQVALGFHVPSLRSSKARVYLATDIWYFPQGQGHHYAQARYGLFVVDKGPSGRGILVDLLDADQQSLKTSAPPRPQSRP